MALRELNWTPAIKRRRRIPGRTWKQMWMMDDNWWITMYKTGEKICVLVVGSSSGCKHPPMMMMLTYVKTCFLVNYIYIIFVLIEEYLSSSRKLRRK